MTLCTVQIPGRAPYTEYDKDRRRLMRRLDEVRAIYPAVRLTIRLARRDRPEQGQVGVV